MFDIRIMTNAEMKSIVIALDNDILHKKVLLGEICLGRVHAKRIANRRSEIVKVCADVSGAGLVLADERERSALCLLE